LVRINGTDSPWVGFVPVSSIREEEGAWQVLALVLEDLGDFLRTALPGSGMSSTTYRAPKSLVKPHRAVEA
jgi:hypothetical protein